MSTLTIQVQPAKSPDIDMARVRELGEVVATDKTLVSRYAVVEGEDKGPYSNLMFETSELKRLWGLLQDTLYKDEQVGSAMSKASMAMCEGSDGWNNYLLLYHFDPSVKLDSINAR
jgi:hypothetical protein